MCLYHSIITAMICWGGFIFAFAIARTPFSSVFFLTRFVSGTSMTSLFLKRLKAIGRVGSPPLRTAFPVISFRRRRWYVL